MCMPILQNYNLVVEISKTMHYPCFVYEYTAPFTPLCGYFLVIVTEISVTSLRELDVNRAKVRLSLLYCPRLPTGEI